MPEAARDQPCLSFDGVGRLTGNPIPPQFLSRRGANAFRGEGRVRKPVNRPRSKDDARG